MPENSIRFLPRKQLLTFEEMVALVEILASLGVNKIRLTGGEPLVREQLPVLIRMLKSVHGIDEIAMTTNGVLLAKHAKDLKDAGLDRLNISLDSLNDEVYQQITRRDVLPQVLEGIHAAAEVGFPIRLNALAIKGLTENQIIPLAQFALQHQMELRFIEYMPLDFDQKWDATQVLSASELLSLMEQHFGKVAEAPRIDPAQPAQDYLYADGKGRLGLIHPVSAPFCDQCNRLRLTAEGNLRNCLFSQDEWDLKTPLREGATTAQLSEIIRQCVTSKWKGHSIGSEAFKPANKSMHQIGG